jgi:beta-barrel assembly-enhancing protease
LGLDRNHPVNGEVGQLQVWICEDPTDALSSMTPLGQRCRTDNMIEPAGTAGSHRHARDAFMKTWVLVAMMAAASSPAYAQTGSFLKDARTNQEPKQKAGDSNLTQDEEVKLGASVSLRIRRRFGVVQDPSVHKYVALVGTLLAQQTERPNLPWTFVVLDTDGVNAFAAPGGFVHVTRGALALVKSEAELAALLGHEMTHVAHNHTLNAIRKSGGVQIGAGGTPVDRAPLLDKLAADVHELVLENSFDQSDELDADTGSIALARRTGYAPTALADFLTRLDERNKDRQQRNGLFASHPETRERIDNVRKIVATMAGGPGQPFGLRAAPTAAPAAGAQAAGRYTSTVKFQPTDIAKISVVAEGSAGPAGSSFVGDDKNSSSNKKDETTAKKGFGLGALITSNRTEKEKQTAQVSASGGARGVGPDRLASGGSNPDLVKVTLTTEELETFRKGSLWN